MKKKANDDDNDECNKQKKNNLQIHTYLCNMMHN